MDKVPVTPFKIEFEGQVFEGDENQAANCLTLFVAEVRQVAERYPHMKLEYLAIIRLNPDEKSDA
jgi:hypothetical protein